jgi:cytochrome c-type biogenesis protein CcmH/NrfG
MRISLDSPIKKVGMLLAAVLAASFYLVLTATAFLAAHFSEKPELADLQKAAHLEPSNAEYRYLLGRYFWLVQHSPDHAVAAYRDAVHLNPHEARYWLDLAGAYQLLGDTNAQRDAL